jgi:hypothetical protein
MQLLTTLRLTPAAMLTSTLAISAASAQELEAISGAIEGFDSETSMTFATLWDAGPAPFSNAATALNSDETAFVEQTETAFSFAVNGVLEGGVGPEETSWVTGDRLTGEPPPTFRLTEAAPVSFSFEFADAVVPAAEVFLQAGDELVFDLTAEKGEGVLNDGDSVFETVLNLEAGDEITFSTEVVASGDVGLGFTVIPAPASITLLGFGVVPMTRRKR